MDGILSPTTASELDWYELQRELARPPAVWDELAQRTSWRQVGKEAQATVDSSPDEELPAESTWADILIATLKTYHAQQHDWEWDEDVAQRSITEWATGNQSRMDGYQRTIAPLYNVEGPEEPIAVGDDLVIRPFTDAERDVLWRGFGKHIGGTGPDPSDLQRWSHTIDHRWQMPDDLMPLDHGPAVEQVQDVVRALRLLHSNMAGAALVWTRPDPPVDQGDPFNHAVLSTRDVGRIYDVPIEHTIAFDLEPPAKIQLGPPDGDALHELVRRMRTGREDRRLALSLRRFDSAYERYSDEDKLIDLWIAFEALLLPDGQTELSYRASMRIALLTAEEGHERGEAFRLARRSYSCRSKVLHGEAVASDLNRVVEETRELARKVLVAWLSDPPGGGIEELDRRIFD